MSKNTKSKSNAEKTKEFILKNQKDVQARSTLKIFFWLGVLAVTIALVIYGEGYGFSISEREITSGGAISITSTPSGATVYIDDVEVGKTPLTISSEEPGTHNVSIYKEGFTFWTSPIVVIGTEAIELEAILFKNADNKAKLSEKEVIDFSVARQEDNLVFLTNTEQGKELYFKEYNSPIWALNTEEQLVSTITTDEKLSISISPFGKNTLIKTPKKISGSEEEQATKGEFYYVVNNKEGAELIELSDVNSLPQIKKVTWPRYSENKLIVETNSQVMSYNIQTKQTVLLYNFPEDTTPIYETTKENNLFYINPSNNLPHSISLEGTDKEALLGTREGQVNLRVPKQMIVDANEDFIVIRSDSEITFLETRRPFVEERQTYKILKDEPANEISLGNISPDGESFLFSIGNSDLYIYKILEPGLSTEEDVSFLIGQENDEIIEKNQVFTWHPNSKNIITLPIRETGTGGVKIIEPETQNINLLFKGKILSPKFGVSSNGDKIVFLGLDEETETQNLYTIDLLDNDLVQLGLLNSHES